MAAEFRNHRIEPIGVDENALNVVSCKEVSPVICAADGGVSAETVMQS